MYFEVGFIILWVLALFGWAIWFNLSTKFYVRRYKPEIDKSRRPSEEDRGFGIGSPITPNNQGTRERGDIPIQSDSGIEENRREPEKTRRQFRNPFSRRS